MERKFEFCPNCGKKSVGGGNLEKYARSWKCGECGLELFNNVASAVGLIIETGGGKILFERRAKEPRSGFLALPGGFVDPDESLEEAAKRECREEIGAEPQSLEYVASFPNTYRFAGVEYKTCDVFFRAKIGENQKFQTQESEVLSLEEISVKSRKELEGLPLAFESARKALEILLKKIGG